MNQKINSEILLGGIIRNININLGINKTPTVATVTIVKDISSITIQNRKTVNIKMGSFSFLGIIQSWSEAKVDIAGTGIYQVKITDTKPVLDAVQVILGSPYDSTMTRGLDYGSNIIGIIPKNNKEIKAGVLFTDIKSKVEKATFSYGSESYKVRFDFTLPFRGVNSEYRLKAKVLSLSELVSQIANDHGFNWYVDTNANNIIRIRFLERKNATSLTVSQLASLHSGTTIRRHEGLENRDAIQKVTLIGGISSFLNQVNGNVWSQFWGFSNNNSQRFSPLFTRQDMIDVISNNVDKDKVSQATIQQISSYANEFWGRKFIAFQTPASTIDSNGDSWAVPVSTAWNNNNYSINGLTADGRSKFQSEDGRWSTFIIVSSPFGNSISRPGNTVINWDNSLYRNTNTSINGNNGIAIKSKLELIKINGKNFVLLTLSSPLQVVQTSLVKGNSVTEKSRREKFDVAYLSLMDKRTTYGPWSTGSNAIGRTEVIIDSALTPWQFGYRGIETNVGVKQMDEVALAKLKTIADTVMDIRTAELKVAGLPQVNIGSQLESNSAITSIQVVFGLEGATTTYKAVQHTNELSKNIRKQQELLDRLSRQSAEVNATWQPAQNDLAIEETIQALKKEIPDPTTETDIQDSSQVTDKLKTVLGRILNSSSLKAPKYDILPTAFVSDVFGSLTLVRDPTVFGTYNNILNMGEKQTTRGRLSPGLDVQVHTFSVTASGISSRYIDVSAPKPSTFIAKIIGESNPNNPIYPVTPVHGTVSDLKLIQSEITALNTVTNLGEPFNGQGFIPIGTQININWNENSDGSFTPFMEQQLNMFKPLS